MSEEKRKNWSRHELLVLLSQVDNHCPMCGEELYRKNSGRISSKYEIAHIYPLNATPNEKEILKDVEILGDNLNSLDNVIPLCRNCHKDFDSEKSVDKYERLLNIKKNLINKFEVKEEYSKLHLEEEIKELLEQLSKDDSDLTPNYEVCKIDNKIKNDVSPLRLREIKSNVAQYFPLIKNLLKILDEKKIDCSSIINGQINICFLKFNRIISDKEELLSEIIKWINKKSDNKYEKAAEILASYYIQSCAIFKEKKNENSK